MKNPNNNSALKFTHKVFIFIALFVCSSAFAESTNSVKPPTPFQERVNLILKSGPQPDLPKAIQINERSNRFQKDTNRQDVYLINTRSNFSRYKLKSDPVVANDTNKNTNLYTLSRENFLTNQPDHISQALSASIERYNQLSEDATLSITMRKTFKELANERKQQLDDHNTNAQLWANVNQARMSKNSESITFAEQKLADYLSAKIGKMQGKTYPPSMSLEAVLGVYQKQAGYSHWYENRPLIRGILLVFAILPPAIMVFVAIKKRFSKTLK